MSAIIFIVYTRPNFTIRLITDFWVWNYLSFLKEFINNNSTDLPTTINQSVNSLKSFKNNQTMTIKAV